MKQKIVGEQKKRANWLEMNPNATGLAWIMIGLIGISLLFGVLYGMNKIFHIAAIFQG